MDRVQLIRPGGFDVAVERHISFKELIKDSMDGYLYLGIDEHSFRVQNLVITVTEIRQRKLLMILPRHEEWLFR